MAAISPNVPKYTPEELYRMGDVPPNSTIDLKTGRDTAQRIKPAALEKMDVDERHLVDSLVTALRIFRNNSDFWQIMKMRGVECAIVGDDISFRGPRMDKAILGSELGAGYTLADINKELNRKYLSNDERRELMRAGISIDPKTRKWLLAKGYSGTESQPLPRLKLMDREGKAAAVTHALEKAEHPLDFYRFAKDKGYWRGARLTAGRFKWALTHPKEEALFELDRLKRAMCATGRGMFKAAKVAGVALLAIVGIGTILGLSAASSSIGASYKE